MGVYILHMWVIFLCDPNRTLTPIELEWRLQLFSNIALESRNVIFGKNDWVGICSAKMPWQQVPRLSTFIHSEGVAGLRLGRTGLTMPWLVVSVQSLELSITAVRASLRLKTWLCMVGRSDWLPPCLYYDRKAICIQHFVTGRKSKSSSKHAAKRWLSRPFERRGEEEAC